MVCSNKHGKVYKDEDCDPAKMPATQRECGQDRETCDQGPRWHASQWEEVSKVMIVVKTTTQIVGF